MTIVVGTLSHPNIGILILSPYPFSLHMVAVAEMAVKQQQPNEDIRLNLTLVDNSA